MLDIGGWEIFMVLAIALIVVGPKDLPILVRKVGTWVGKARSMARDFQSGMNQAAREAELDDLKKTADVSGALKEETRRINSDLRSAGEGGVSTSSTPRTPAEVRSAGLERSAPENRPAAASVGSSAAASAPAAGAERRPTRDDEDEDVLAGFQRGVRSGNEG